jgi:hypothetical protein
MSRASDVAKGVEDAWSCWLYDHPVSVPEIIEDAVAKAVTDWIDQHSQELIEAIASAVAARSIIPLPPSGEPQP